MIHGKFKEILNQEMTKPYFKELEIKVSESRNNHLVFPKEEDVLRAFELTPFEEVKVVILGQDPYHNVDQAHGLSFSVNKNQALPKSLINMYKELETDLGILNTSGDLSSWARQGILLLNTVLTVEAHKPGSHQNMGWEVFTDRIISELSDRQDPIIFVLWGKKAQDKKTLIKDHHLIIESVHPSPLSAYRGFFGSKPFSKINEYLIDLGKTPIDWEV